MKKLLITLLVPVILGTVLLTCRQQERKEKASQSIDESAIAVKLAPVQTGEYSLPVIS
jgi:hypothetical protein